MTGISLAVLSVATGIALTAATVGGSARALCDCVIVDSDSGLGAAMTGFEAAIFLGFSLGLVAGFTVVCLGSSAGLTGSGSA